MVSLYSRPLKSQGSRCKIQGQVTSVSCGTTCLRLSSYGNEASEDGNGGECVYSEGFGDDNRSFGRTSRSDRPKT